MSEHNEDEEEEGINTEAANDKPAEPEDPNHPWYDSRIMILTEAEKVESEAWDKQRKRDYEALESALDESTNYGLTFEILLYAFDHLKSYPTCTIEEAIGHGFCEWVK